MYSNDSLEIENIFSATNTQNYLILIWFMRIW